MISLDNTYNEDDLKDFDTRIQKLTTPTPLLAREGKSLKEMGEIEYTIEFKFDGL